MSQSTAIIAQHAFEPANGDDAYEMAKRLVASRLLPKAVSTPEAAFAIIVTGRELGMTAMQSLRGIHIIEGKPVLSADTMLALALRDARCEYFTIVTSTNEVATLETKRRGAPEPTRMSFSVDDAKLAGLTGKDNWRKYPAAMLRARCIAALARVVYPDIFMGVYDADSGEIEAAPAPAPARVKSTVVNAKPRAPEPTRADEANAVELLETFAARIEAAATLTQLAQVGKTISTRKNDMDPVDLICLQSKYLDRKNEITAATAAPDAPTSSPAVDGEAAAQ